jgi:hypothetical protein
MRSSRIKEIYIKRITEGKLFAIRKQFCPDKIIPVKVASFVKKNNSSEIEWLPPNDFSINPKLVYHKAKHDANIERYYDTLLGFIHMCEPLELREIKDKQEIEDNKKYLMKNRLDKKHLVQIIKDYNVFLLEHGLIKKKTFKSFEPDVYVKQCRYTKQNP